MFCNVSLYRYLFKQEGNFFSRNIRGVWVWVQCRLVNIELVAGLSLKDGNQQFPLPPSLIPWHFLENQRIMKQEELPSCSFPCPLIAYIYTQQLEIWVSVPSFCFQTIIVWDHRVKLPVPLAIPSVFVFADEDSKVVSKIIVILWVKEQVQILYFFHRRTDAEPRNWWAIQIWSQRIWQSL